MKALWREYLKVVLQKKWHFLFLLMAIVFINILEVTIPTYYKEIVNIFGLNPSPEGIEIIYQAFFGTMICYAFIWTIWLLFDFFAIIPHQAGGMKELDKIGFKALQNQKYQFFQNEFSGKIVKKVGKFVRVFEDVSDWFLFNFWNSITLIIFTFIAFYSQDVGFAYVFLIWIIVFLSFTTWFALFSYKYNKRASEADSAIGGAYADSFANIFTVKSSGIEHKEFNIAEGYIEDHHQKLRISWFLQFTMFRVQGLLSIGIELYFIYLMIQQWENGTFEVGQFVLFQSLILFMINRIWEFGRSMRNLFSSLADASEMAEIMQITDIEKDSPNTKHNQIKHGEIDFRNMYFGYEADGLFKDFNLKIPAGQKVALVGHSGSGKTTLTNLLFRFFEPQRGGIYFDDIESKDFTYQSLRSQISLVPQNPEMFHRTLRENITLGKETTDEQIWEALKKAQGYEFAQALPEKLETMIGERGVKLSGGEKQRVAIARAFLDASQIVVLDEATSALDSITEAELQKGIFNLIEGKTAIVIAHRLSTVMQMDRIVVMEKGKILETGNHAELISQNGKYAEMWQHQRGGFLGEE